MVGDALEQLGHEVRIITRRNDFYDGVPKNNHRVMSPERAENILPVNFNHVGLAFRFNGDWYTHDAKVTLKGLDLFGEWHDDVSEVYFTVKQAKSFAKRASFWNLTFNRRKGKKIIQDAIEKYLKIA